MAVTLVALWLENSLLASMAAIAVVWLQSLWVLDFAAHLLLGIRIFGFSDYMFDPKVLVVARWLSRFHIWLPILLVWVVFRLGYDRRALAAQTLCAWLVLALSYGLTKDIHGPAGNLNMVYGLSNHEPQTWMPPLLWLGVVMLAAPVCIYGPVHFVFRRFSPQEGTTLHAAHEHRRSL